MIYLVFKAGPFIAVCATDGDRQYWVVDNDISVHERQRVFNKVAAVAKLSIEELERISAEPDPDWLEEDPYYQIKIREDSNARTN